MHASVREIAQKSSHRQRQHASVRIAESLARFIALLTAQRIFAIKTRRINNQAAVSQDYLLGEAHFVRKRKIWSHFPFVIARSNEVATWQSSVAKCGFALIPTLTLWMTKGWGHPHPNGIMTIGIFEYSITQTKFGYHRAICTISSQRDIIAFGDIIG